MPKISNELASTLKQMTGNTVLQKHLEEISALPLYKPNKIDMLKAIREVSCINGGGPSLRQVKDFVDLFYDAIPGEIDK